MSWYRRLLGRRAGDGPILLDDVLEALGYDRVLSRRLVEVPG